eukprot:TRINITY_DN6117_c1_g1_i1.p1 TRINITY_DN6117_c1_g1~~TRINITY_DN6117_c1_g1_i1.p1  ORF type:complete len:387 (-),score=69.43 TRINITY_DN6117_c1_g1_i1:289-1287(-)
MAQYDHLNDADTRSIVDHYGLGVKVSLNYLDGGWANSNFRLETDQDTYVIKINREKTLSELVQQIDVLAFFERHHFSAVVPVSAAGASAEDIAQSYIYTLPDGQMVCVYVYLHGHPGKEGCLTERSLTDIGQRLGSLHALTYECMDKLPPFPMGLVAMDGLLGEVKGREETPFIRYLQDSLDNGLRDLINNKRLPHTLIHGDIFPDNCIFGVDGVDDALAAIIDWEEIACGPAVLDVAMTIVGCCYSAQGVLSPALVSAFLSAYKGGARPMTALEVEVLPRMVEFACLSIATWRYRQFVVKFPNPELAERYVPMMERAQACRPLMVEVMRLL